MVAEVTGNDTLRAEASYLRAYVLLTAAGEEDEGFRALQVAMTLGFSDVERLTELVEHEGLVGHDRVVEYLDESGVFGDGGSGEGETESGGETEGTAPNALEPPSE